MESRKVILTFNLVLQDSYLALSSLKLAALPSAAAPPFVYAPIAPAAELDCFPPSPDVEID